MDLCNNIKMNIKLENINDIWVLTIKNKNNTEEIKFCAMEGIKQEDIITTALTFAKFEDVDVKIDFTRHK